jgi:peptidoglycan/LPS O-acetylase OafA/YrhL
MKSKSLPQKDHLPGLNGLRALAALSVFGVHFNQIVQLDGDLGPFNLYRLLSNGDHAVSLFLSLSGFLLSLPFWNRLVSGKPLPSIRNYLIRRLTRILPAYYVVLTVLVLLSGLWRVPGARVDILLHYTFLFNYTEFSIFSIDPPFWTLAVEMQLYLLLPVLFVLGRRLSERKLCWIFGAVAILAYGLHCWLIHVVSHVVPWPYDPVLTWIRPNGAVLNHSVLANMPHFLMGVLMARLFLHVKQLDFSHRKRQLICELLFWLCLMGTLVLLGSGWDRYGRLPNGAYGFPSVPFMLAVMIVTIPFTRMARFCMDSFILRTLGMISFGVYIIHMPVLIHLDHIMTQRGVDVIKQWPLFACATLAITCLLALVSYLVVERPCLRWMCPR